MKNQPPNTPVAAQPPSGSTGPRTEAGKAVSSQNARKHDLCSRTLRLSPEEWAEYNDMRERYGRDLQPADDVEQTIIDEICFNYWRLQQAREVELQIILEHPTELPIISLYIRYRTGYERAFYKALDKIHQAQRIRKQQAAKPNSVRSADSAVCDSQSLPPKPVRSATTAPSPEAVAEAALHLEDRLETHLLENKIRNMQQLPPLEMPTKLAAQFDRFVSQNPGALSEDLLNRIKKAA